MSNQAQQTQQIQSVLITGKRWFERTNGNTYFSAKGYVNGELVASIEYEYGYGEQYLQEMTRKLESLGFMPGREHHENGSAEPAWRYFQERNIPFSYEVSDVSRKKDL